jgi:hypothetical protein
MQNNFIQFGGRLFFLYRKIRSTPKISKNTEIIKKHFHCDTVLKKDGIFYFCNEVPDIEFEEIIENEN